MESFTDLEPFDKRILVYIHRVFHHPTRKDIEAFFFPSLNLGEKERYVQRRLEHLVRHKYISYHNSFVKESGREEREYYLLAKGAGAIGEKLKRQDYKAQGKGIYESRKARSLLAYVAHEKSWSLVEDENTMRLHLFSYIQDIEEKRRQERPRVADVNSVLPDKITPDLLLVTGSKIYIVIIADRLAEKGYFRRRAARYEKIINYTPLVFITLFKEQCEDAKSALPNASFINEEGILISASEADHLLLLNLPQVKNLSTVLV